MTVADRVVVANGGIIEQAGPPQESYHHLSQPVRKAGFIGPPFDELPERAAKSFGVNGLIVGLYSGARGRQLPLTVPPARPRLQRQRYDEERWLSGIRPESISSLQTPSRS